jgi:hypothetical protein
MGAFNSEYWRSIMSIDRWIFLSGFGIFIVYTIVTLIQIARRAATNDLSEGKGPILPAVFYSMTGAMSPIKKETAYLHLPTYTLGIVYHLGSFLALFWLIFHFFRFSMPDILIRLSTYGFMVTGLCGLIILIKRIVNSKLRHLSTPDDYFSNVLVTGFHFVSAAALFYAGALPWLFVVSGLLFAYMPVGKMRHVLYFFVSRFYLGIFYGKRGVWPPGRRNAWQTKNL